MKRAPTKPIPPPHILQEWYDYNPDTGVLAWKKIPPHVCACVGDEVGSIVQAGNGKEYIVNDGDVLNFRFNT